MAGGFCPKLDRLHAQGVGKILGRIEILCSEGLQDRVCQEGAPAGIDRLELGKILNHDPQAAAVAAQDGKRLLGRGEVSDRTLRRKRSNYS